MILAGVHSLVSYSPYKGFWAHGCAPLQALIKIKWGFETVSAVPPYTRCEWTSGVK
jgi:hypothetical protein